MKHYMTAQEIADWLRRPVGTIHRWACTYQWRRTEDGRRPVLYAMADIERTLRSVGQHAGRPSKLDATSTEA